MTDETPTLLSHNSFPQPSDRESKVWRYLTLSKLLDFFFTESLFLSRIDLLDDAYEGTFTRLNSVRRPFEAIKLPSGASLDQTEYTNRFRISSYVNCWRMDESESEAMWKLYCPNNEGIAIQTTYNKLALSLPPEKYLYLGMVKYLNYETDTFDRTNHYYSVMHKRIAFEHEKEIRIVKGHPGYMNDHTLPPPEHGIKIKTSLLPNIENIYINPYATKWYFDMMKQLFEQLNIKIKLEWSAIKATVYY